MKVRTILVIIQRSNGDVLLSSSLINQLNEHLEPEAIDLLVNIDTLPIAKTLSNVRQIHTFSYKEKNENRFNQERKIITKIYRKYDLSINLTASDRSVLYALLAGRKSISAVEDNFKKSWWKKLLLSFNYIFNTKQRMLLNNHTPLKLLGITSRN